MYLNQYIQRYNPLRFSFLRFFSHISRIVGLMFTSTISLADCDNNLVTPCPPVCSLAGQKRCSWLVRVITARLQLRLPPGGLSCPTGRPLRPGPTWQRWSPRSC